MKKYINFLVAFNEKLNNGPLISLWLILSVIFGIIISLNLIDLSASLPVTISAIFLFSVSMTFILLLVYGVLLKLMKFPETWAKIKNAFKEAAEEELKSDADKQNT